MHISVILNKASGAMLLDSSIVAIDYISTTKSHDIFGSFSNSDACSIVNVAASALFILLFH